MSVGNSHGTRRRTRTEQRRYVIGPRALQVALTHEQIATLAGTSRETVTKSSATSRSGVVRSGRGRVTILDARRMADEADRT